MRKSTIHKLVSLLIVLVLSVSMSSIYMSCTESVTLELNGVSPQIVVDAAIPEADFAIVMITKTVDFNKLNNFPPVAGALVKLQEENGFTETLTEITPGYYRSSTIKGIPGVNYKLTVEVEGLIMYSEEVMPKSVRINSLRARKVELPDGLVVDRVFDSPRTELIVTYDDTRGEANFYRFIEYINGKQTKSHLFDDRFNDGKVVKNFLLDFKRRLTVGDTLVVEMQSLSKQAYGYLFGFSLMNALPQGTTPSNPVSNISGAKLGYFSAFTFYRDTLVIEEL
jgi:hypothetical protein